jgi:transketolase
MSNANRVNLLVYARKLARQARVEILGMTHRANASHVASALSVVDIIALFYSIRNNQDSESNHQKEMNTLILSKGHAAAALYSVLYLIGKIRKIDIEEFYNDGAVLGGHVSHDSVEEVVLSTGSLGHGIPYGAGIALANQMSGKDEMVLVIISDGECDEGTTWETALIANQFKLDNLIVIVDRNGLQSLGPTESTVALEPLPEKWISFGWECIEIDGHNQDALLSAIEQSQRSNKPSCIIAKTVKGKGVSFMENSVRWHYRPPDNDEYQAALTELEVSTGEK